MSSLQNSPPPAARNHLLSSEYATNAAPSASALDETTKRTALVIASPSEAQTSQLQQFTNVMERAGIALIHRAASPDRLDSLIRSMQSEIGCVVLTGGNHVFRSAAVALRDTGLPVGLLPLGPADDLARRLDIPSDPARAAALIRDGHQRSLNLGMVNGQPFLSVASVGLTVQDARLLGRVAQHRSGRLAFAWQAARLALRTGRFAAIIRCGSTIHRVHTVQITIGNGHAYVGRMEPGTEQLGVESLLDVYSLEPASKWRFLFLRHAFTAQDHDVVPEARRAQGSTVEIVTRLPRPITVDGEIVAITPARFTVLSGAVNVFAPPPVPQGPTA